MQIEVLFAGERLNLISYNLCHVDGKGDYEVFANRELALDMKKILKKLKDEDYQIEGANDQIILAKKDLMDITVFPQGRMIIERLVPDEAQLSLDIAASLLDMEKTV